MRLAHSVDSASIFSDILIDHQKSLSRKGYQMRQNKSLPFCGLDRIPVAQPGDIRFDFQPFRTALLVDCGFDIVFEALIAICHHHGVKFAFRGQNCDTAHQRALAEPAWSIDHGDLAGFHVL